MGLSRTLRSRAQWGALALLLGTGATSAGVSAEPVPAPSAPICPNVELVFCLDTTGSMGDLLEGAKARIWGIINGVSRALNGPRIRVGLVAFRDRGDAYLTQVLDLTDNLESVHARLKGFSAVGGGDTPESVNQALSDAVRKVSWSPAGAKVYRAIFLVGDAPPHMDYADDVKYPLSCKEGRARGVVINAIQCGTDGACRAEWTRIASLSEGGFAAIPQSGGMRVVSTPYDTWLAEFSGRLLGTAVYAGSPAQRKRLKDQQTEVMSQSVRALRAKDLGLLASEADRSEFRGKAGRVGSGGLGLGEESGQSDLTEVFRLRGPAGLKAWKPADLPDELQGLPEEDLMNRLRLKAEEREGLLRQIQDLADLRDAELERERKKSPDKAFDDEVLDLIRRQAAALCH